jgi:hypothetical protein
MGFRGRGSKKGQKTLDFRVFWALFGVFGPKTGKNVKKPCF